MLFCPSGPASHLKAAPFEACGSKLATGATNETSDLFPGRLIDWIARAPGGRIALLLFPRLRHLPLVMLDINLAVSRGPRFARDGGFEPCQGRRPSLALPPRAPQCPDS